MNNRIRELRKALGLSQKEFAEKLVAKGFSFEQLPLTADQLADQLLKKMQEAGEAK